MCLKDGAPVQPKKGKCNETHSTLNNGIFTFPVNPQILNQLTPMILGVVQSIFTSNLAVWGGKKIVP